MSKRKPITERMKIDALLLTAFEFFAEYKSLGIGHVIFCPICLLPILPGQPIDWDHAHAVGLSGPHVSQNIRPMHRDCHKRKTFGTKATTAGSDIGKIAKCRRIVRTEKFVVKKHNPGPSMGGFARAMDMTPERRTEIAKKAAKARWGSRPFPPAGSRPMRGNRA